MAEDKSKMVHLDTSGDEVEIVLDEQESKNKKETKDHGEVKEQVNVEETQEDVSQNKKYLTNGLLWKMHY